MRTHKKSLHRELEFTARFTAAEIAQFTGRVPTNGLEGEFMVVQGAIDLAVLLEKEIWILDFKTDGVGGKSLQERSALYAPQVKLYAAALERIYLKPVTRAALYFLATKTAVSIPVRTPASS